MRAYRALAAMAISVPISLGAMRAVSWFMSPPAPAVVRTPLAQITPLREDVDSLERLGRELIPAQITAMKQRVEKDPGDVRSRALLLSASWGAWEDADLKTLHNEQVVWFVANLPDSPVLSAIEVNVDQHLNVRTYDLVCELYDQALAKRPNDVAILANYADLILVPETDQAIALLTHAAELDPKNPERYERLAHARFLASRRLFLPPDSAGASLAVDAYMKAKALGGRVHAKFFLEATFDAGRYDVAEREAKAALRDHNSADAVHAAHTALGRIALQKENVAAARTHLLDSAKVTGSPVLGSFGPGMELAKELLAKGERKTVLAYLKACGKFWDDERQVRWTKTVEDGGTPDWN